MHSITLKSGLAAAAFMFSSAQARTVVRDTEWLDVDSDSDYKIEVPSITPTQVLDFSKTAWGSPYILGGSRWDAEDRDWGGPDCAGLVLKSWGWPLLESSKTAMAPSYVVDGKHVPGKLHTSTFNYNAFPWTVHSSFSYSTIAQGDAFTFYRGGATGHTFLVLKKNSSVTGSLSTSEARSTSMGVGSFTRLLTDIRASGYKLNKPTFMKAADAPRETAAPIATTPLTHHHAIRSGETLQSISQSYAVPVSHISRLNPGVDWRRLNPGMRVRIL